MRGSRPSESPRRPTPEKSFETGDFTLVMDEFRRGEVSLQGGFAFAVADDRAEASFHAPSAVASDS